MTKYIYVLVDPTDGKVRYVGQAKDCHSRMTGHLNSKDSCVSEWIANLRRMGQRPQMLVVDEVADSGAGALEQEWISMLWQRYPLLNRIAYPYYPWVASPVMLKWSRVQRQRKQPATTNEVG